MAADYFLKIDGIKGESLDDKHKDEIDVLSFSWGVSQSGTMNYGGGGGEGKATFHDLSFVHKIDKSSPVLMQTCANGTHIKEASMVGEKSSDRGGEQFLKYTFKDVIISSYQDAASQAGDVTNVAALRFASVKVEAAPGARVDVRPAATGNLKLDPATGEPTIVEGQSGLLLSGPVIDPDGILIGLLRGVSEFSLVGVPGLITGPTPRMRLVLGIQEVRTLGEQPPVDTNLAAAVNDLVTADRSEDKQKKPKKKSLQHNIYWYAPADLELTTEDFGRKGRRLGQIQLDPDADPLRQDFDITDLVLEGGFDSIGIRIQSAMDHAQPGGEEDQNEDESEGVSAESRAAGRNATAFTLTLEVVAD